MARQKEMSLKNISRRKETNNLSYARQNIMDTIHAKLSWHKSMLILDLRDYRKKLNLF